MGRSAKVLIPLALGAGAIIASGGLATPAVAGVAGAGTAGAGAGGLLGAASGMTGTALGAGEAEAASLAPMVAGESLAPFMGQELVRDAVVNPITGGLLEATTPALTALEGTAGTQIPTSLIPLRDLSQGAVGMTPLSTFDKMKAFGDKYGTVQNLTGAGNMAMKYAEMNKPKPIQAQSGQVSRGQAPTLEGLLALQKMGYALPQNKKINFSLLG